jgi:glycosyltransferase involved in cell wall biosynthesis
VKKVAVIGVVGIPACYGGFESLVENLTLNNSQLIEYTVFCSAKSYPQKKQKHNDANLKYIPIRANGIFSIFYDIWALLICLFNRPDVILVLGVSGCIFLPIFRFFSSSYIVTNIDGLEWKRDKWKNWQKRFLKFSESIAVRFSDIVVCDNQAISDYVFSEYSISSETITYGGDHALQNISSNTNNQSYVLGLCRIEPENNVEMILEAFAISQKNLKFIGNWKSSNYGRSLYKKYYDFHNIALIDPIYDIEDLYHIRKNCSIYVHGHSAGGTNPSLVEMMHFSIPIVAFDCIFNRNTTYGEAIYFESSNQLNEILENTSAQNLIEIGNSMKKLATKKYTWKKISGEYERIFLR